LTEDAADAALDVIDFIAAAVRGVDLIDVTPSVRVLWRAHLAAWFSQLPPWTRGWYANAPFLLNTIRIQWPLLVPMQQAAIAQQWAVELPAMLWMLQPVLAQVQANDAWSQAMADHLAQVAAQQAPTPDVSPPPATPAAAPVPSGDRSAAAINALNHQMDINNMLAAGATRMNFATTTLMHAMSGRP
jgi:hypothetical protein